MDVRQALEYCEKPWTVDRDFDRRDRELAWSVIEHFLNRRWDLDPLAAEVHRLRQERLPRVSTSRASLILLAMEAGR